MKRQKSREKAMELLFSMELSKNSYDETIETFIEDYEMDLKTIDVEYIKNVVKVVTDNLGTIDDKILRSLVNWKLDRISKVNLTILRLAVGEMLFIEDVPGVAAINEAVELTKKYSDDKSSSFINGVLDKILKTTLEQ
ncbi:MAG: transcription antitermination factor NusB [Clostridium sp.]|uniref:transcription antitermination factor NusB n=1 Tax=Clostridium sp. TaxID=1506 RepID=UPI00399B4274